MSNSPFSPIPGDKNQGFRLFWNLFIALHGTVKNEENQ